MSSGTVTSMQELISLIIFSTIAGESHDYEKALERRLNILQYWLEKEENGNLKLALESCLQSDGFNWEGDNNIR